MMIQLKRQNKGFTLLEIIVTLSVIGVLFALLIPAIQAARLAALRARCMGNLRQLGIALAAYEGSYQVFPAGSNGRGYSPHAMLLPYLEERVVYNSINFNYSARDFGQMSINATASNSTIALFVCPSETAPAVGFAGRSNYAGSGGVTRRDHRDNGAFRVFSGKPTGLQSFKDGASTTIVMSEWLMGHGALGSRDYGGLVFETPDVLLGSNNFSKFIDECNLINPFAAAVSNYDKGHAWIESGFGHTMYNHILTIGEPSCTSGGMVLEGAYTAGSYHPGGAHVLFGDGYVRFVGKTIDRATWRGLGTLNGGEVISSDSF